MRISSAIVIGIIGVGLLTGCGSTDSSSEYCAAAAELGKISIRAGTTTTDMVSKSRNVAAVAPADIKADWEIYAKAQERLAAAGKTPTDLSDPTKALDSLDTRARETEEAAAALSAATPKITTHLEQNCK
ncbi:hypothetical protein [Nocardia brasiliensis]|uniref:hypothetical protein n=1 Tax=Nocardia brasiliensis TaxID=37326 RepID=UPI002458257A|nr:hypothetical protein [Nocardia brasiliensis]